jgi:hypothetical protein
MWLNRSMRIRPRRAAIAIIAIAVPLLIAPVSAGSNPRGTSSSIRGTWVLEQVMTRKALHQRAPALRDALRVPGVVGFSIRVPWTLLEPTKGHYDLRVIDRARQLAAPKQLSVRFIAGVYTPPFRMGHSMIYDGSVTGGVGAGRAVPLPFAADGGPNRRFERGWTLLVDRLADWSIQHHLSLLHLAWPGLVWSEMGVTDQMMGEPGYSYTEARDTHLRLLDHGLAVSTPALSVEFPFAGFVPSQLYVDLKQHLLASSRRGHCILLANNLTDHTSPLLHEAPPPRRAAQMLQPDNTYDWSAVFDDARTMYAEYVEIYTPSFSGGTSDQLPAEILAFSNS